MSVELELKGEWDWYTISKWIYILEAYLLDIYKATCLIY